jgi:hypothetical protein
MATFREGLRQVGYRKWGSAKPEAERTWECDIRIRFGI